LRFAMRDGSLNEYKRLWDSMVVLPEWAGRVGYCSRQVLAGKSRYLIVAQSTGAPWWIVGLIHLMEASCDWTANLHNGERWDRVTRLVPKGRGPFACWEEAAIDAIRYDGLDQARDWSVAEGLRQLERYNGGGYLRRGVHSPYLWSGTQHGIGVGKYVSDGRYDPDAVSQQVGAAAVLQRILGLDPSSIISNDSNAIHAVQVAVNDVIRKVGLHNDLLVEDGILGQKTRATVRSVFGQYMGVQ